MQFLFLQKQIRNYVEFKESAEGQESQYQRQRITEYSLPLEFLPELMEHSQGLTWMLECHADDMKSSVIPLARCLKNKSY